tara:strand:- start:2788 stop:3639 length:852 start_codon:yes stop_codon:yes gene_type:complete
MLRTGFGAKTAKTVSSTAAGKQNLADRGLGSDGVIRSISGEDLAVWLDASDITGLADAAKVTSWTAKEGIAPAQPSSGKQPTYRVAGFNSRPSVRFDGSTENALSWSAGLVSDVAQMANTIVAVNYTAADGATSMLFEMDAYYQNWLNIGMYYNGSDKLVAGLGTSPGNSGDEASSETVCPDINNVFICTFDRNTNPDSIVTYINSEPSTPGSQATYNSSAGTAWNIMPAYIGSRNNAANFPLDGDVREFVILNRALDEGEAFRLGSVLMSKSGLTLRLSDYP